MAVSFRMHAITQTRRRRPTFDVEQFGDDVLCGGIEPWLVQSTTFGAEHSGLFGDLELQVAFRRHMKLTSDLKEGHTFDIVLKRNN
jgi:hypothetical protein